jgi:hypothetical protein
MFSDMSEKTPRSKIKVQIDENLKRIYDEVLHEEVPDRFKSLLQQLRDKTEKGGGPS